MTPTEAATRLRDLADRIEATLPPDADVLDIGTTLRGSAPVGVTPATFGRLFAGQIVAARNCIGGVSDFQASLDGNLQLHADFRGRWSGAVQLDQDGQPVALDGERRAS